MTSLLLRSQHRLTLAAHAGGGDSLAPPVRGCADAADHRVDAVAIGDRIAQALEHDAAGSLAHHEAVCSHVEWGRMGRRERTDGAELGVGRRVHRAVRRPGEHHVDLTRVQQVTGVHQGGEGGGTGGVGAVIRTLQVEQVGHPSGNHVCQLAGHRVLVDLRCALCNRLLERLAARLRHPSLDSLACDLVGPHPEVRQVAVLSSEGIGEHDPGARIRQLLVALAIPVAGIGQRVRSDGHRPQLAFVDLCQSPWRLLPAAPVELEALDERADLRVGLVLLHRPGPAFDPEVIHLPAVGGDVPERHMRLQHVGPERGDIVGVWQQRRHADDCHRLERVLRRLVDVHRPHPRSEMLSGTMIVE